MNAASDDLTKPLGQDRPPRRPGLRWGRIATIGLALVTGSVVATVLGAAIYGDPRGGRPVVRSEITTPPAVPPTARNEPEARPAGSGTRRDAGTVEADSGVHVVRPGGATAPPSIVVQVPEVGAKRLAPAPDPRLSDSTRHGILPRQGDDGAKAIDVYGRPAGELSGGRRAVGRIAIVIGGLGLSRSATEEAITRLPAPVTLAFAPYGVDLGRDNDRAREAGHETMLQVPMEPFDYPDSDPGPRTLTTGAKPAENNENLHWAMGRFVGYVGLMNYMGGKLTADDKALLPVLREAGQRGIGFLDDGSSSRSRVTALAGETRASRADLVIDAVPRADLIDKSLERLETIAQSGRLAVGTASALPVTIERIARWAEKLEARGILLVPASAAMPARRRDSASR